MIHQKQINLIIMKTDIGMNNYSVKIAGVLLSAVGLIAYLLFSLLGYDTIVIENLTITRLATWLFGCGLMLFLFSKDRNKEETSIRNTNTISRVFLTALYACLIVFSLIQSLNNDFSIDLLIPVLFFLVIQLIFTTVVQYRHISNKSLYIISSVMFIIGLVVIWFI